MMINPDLLDYVRTMIRGDYAANDVVEARLDADGWDGFPRFLAALFFVAVDRRFGTAAGPPEVIKFVGDLRAGLGEDSPDIQPDAAERLILSIIDPSVDYSISQDMIGRIQAATIQKILTEEDFSDAELDALLAEAAELAQRA
ncbi:MULTISPECIES: hypothetical protein [unclassified Micromonospora]|uniref:hypothetical protein n=1 Tax=unclassified Micromonospora TaxID=2617518 RepID=UPI001FB77411|nr:MULTISPECIES: hypothetical protein [unclassified Micromonospora]